VTDLNWTKGINPKTGSPTNTIPSSASDLNPRRARCAATATKRACPTHGGRCPHQPTAFHPVKNHRLRGRIEGCFTRRRDGRVNPRNGDVDVKATKRDYTSDLYYGSGHGFTRRGQVIAKSEIRDPSGAIVTAGAAWCHGAADGWVVPTTNETLNCGASTSAPRSRARRSLRAFGPRVSSRCSRGGPDCT